MRSDSGRRMRLRPTRPASLYRAPYRHAMPPERRVDAGLRKQLQQNLARFEARAEANPELRPAAVSIVVTDDEHGDPCCLITRRPETLRRHPGQWALPGGRLDAGETALEGGLRELEEELGVALGPESLLGELDVYETRSGFAIQPLVLWAGPSCEVEPDPTEVASWHHVPFSELEKPEGPQLRRIPESDRPVIVLPIIGAEINAPTAAILYQFLEVAIRGKGTRVAHYEQPVFAWK